AHPEMAERRVVALFTRARICQRPDSAHAPLLSRPPSPLDRLAPDRKGPSRAATSTVAGMVAVSGPVPRPGALHAHVLRSYEQRPCCLGVSSVSAPGKEILARADRDCVPALRTAHRVFAVQRRGP